MPDVRNLSAVFPVPVERWGKRVIKYPLRGDRTHFTVESEYHVSRAMFSPTPLSTPHPDYPSAVLIDEQPTSIESDFMILTRKYATIPISHSEPSVAAFPFPAFVADSGGTVLRQILTFTVLVRIQSDYFLTDDPFGQRAAANAIPVFGQFSPRLDNNDVQFVADPSAGFLGTIPDLTTYIDWVANGNEIVAKGSEIEQYAGNIWKRTTLYAKAR